MKNLNKNLKIAAATLAAFAALLSAGPAAAEVAIGVSPEGYMHRPVDWGKAAAAQRLSEKAERLSAATESGNSAAAEEALAGLFSGSKTKREAAPVYLAAAPAPVAAAPAKPAIKLSAAPARKAAPALALAKASKSIEIEGKADLKDPKAEEAKEDSGAAKPQGGPVDMSSAMTTADLPVWKTATTADYAAGTAAAEDGEAKPAPFGEKLLAGAMALGLVLLLIVLL